jgi:hypothetical protein
MRRVRHGYEQSSRFRASTLILAMLYVLIAGCALSDSSGVPETIDQALEWIDTLRLEETESVLVAVPHLREDPLGGWLYWDSQLDEARRYDRDGKLATVIGRKGEGPGEFTRITALVRLADGRFATMDGRGRLATWNESGELQRDISTGLSTRGVAALPDNRLAIVLPPQQDGNKVWGVVVQALDVDQGSIDETLFSAALALEYLPAANTVRPPLPRVYGNRIHVTLLDSAWVVPVADGETRAYSLRPATGDSIAPIAGGSAAREEVRNWLTRTVFIGEFSRLSDGSWIVGTYRVHGNQIRHGLRRLDADGRPVWDLVDAPRFLEADSNDLLYFADAEGLDPAKVRVGRLRS